MLDKLLELILQFIDDILPFTVIDHYDRGFRLRFGKERGTELQPGLHWKLPFIDKILSHMVKTKTINLSEQTITTKDKQSVVIQCAIKYEVSDVKTLLLEVNDPVDALADMVQGIIRDKIISKNWEDCNDEALTSEISDAAKKEAKQWGLKIKKVTITTLAIMRSIRILNK
jgi:membrane protease subunit HflC